MQVVPLQLQQGDRLLPELQFRRATALLAAVAGTGVQHHTRQSTVTICPALSSTLIVSG